MSIKQAMLFNKRVVLLSELDPGISGLEWADVNRLQQDIIKLESVYTHMSTNSKFFEMVCIKRWIILRNYMLHTTLQQVYYSDSDVMIYDDLTEVYSKYYSEFDACYTLPEIQANFRWSASACCSYWSYEAIRRFVDFIFECYGQGISKLEEKWSYHLKNNVKGGICDMTLLYLFHDKVNFRSLSLVCKEITFDQNITDSENYYKDEYEMEFSAELGVNLKKIEWKEEKPYSFNLVEKRNIRFIVLTEYAKLLLNKDKTNQEKPNFLRNMVFRIKNKIWRILKGNKKTKSGWFGNYATWKEAEVVCTGYNSEIILNKVRLSIQKIKKGEAVYERDSVLFNEIQYSLPLMEALKEVSENGELSIVDFGGSLGSTYFQNRDSLYGVRKFKWAIVEQKHFVDCGKSDFETEELRFFYNIDEAIAFAGKKVILLSSVIQYFEKPYQLIHEILNYGFEYIIIDRTAFLNSEQERITVQVVPDFIYKASYPVWFLNEKKFISAFMERYELISDFNSKFDPEENLEDGSLAYRKGFVFKIRKK